jgi:hypothetical protein
MAAANGEKHSSFPDTVNQYEPGNRPGASEFRVHECVFAVLALESDPVDPRL